ncbi:MAG: sleB [Clostridiales bacterium]|nr:sleB [Clostridiales bacterium]
MVILFTVILTSFTGVSTFLTSSIPHLNPGSTGDEVKKVQQRLKNWGYYNDDIDGNYGLNTFLAMKDFQKSYGLNISGLADEKTLMSMGLSTLVRGGVAYAQGGGTSEEQLLARAINGEARGESYEGQVAVGAVILNRTRSAEFPKTIAGVIYQPGAFTAVSDGQINVPIDPKSSVVKAARDSLNGWDPTYGCLYYWNPATATSKWIWSRTIVTTIGKHHFGK